MRNKILMLVFLFALLSAGCKKHDECHPKKPSQPSSIPVVG